MGSQQLLLVVVGVVLVGIMLAVGLFLFRDQASATNRDAVSNDLASLAAAAQKYYRRPAVLGGGQSSFAGLTLPKMTTKPTNANGSYVLTPSPVPIGTTSVNIVGTGTETGDDDTTPVTLTMTVWADSILIVMNN